MRLFSISIERCGSFLDDDTDTNGAVFRIDVLGLLLEISLTASWIKR